jgi:hypothetical protein
VVEGETLDDDRELVTSRWFPSASQRVSSRLCDEAITQEITPMLYGCLLVGVGIRAGEIHGVVCPAETTTYRTLRSPRHRPRLLSPSLCFTSSMSTMFPTQEICDSLSVKGTEAVSTLQVDWASDLSRTLRSHSATMILMSFSFRDHTAIIALCGPANQDLQERPCRAPSCHQMVVSTGHPRMFSIMSSADAPIIFDCPRSEFYQERPVPSHIWGFHCI